MWKEERFPPVLLWKMGAYRQDFYDCSTCIAQSAQALPAE